jgi:uncharacterized protein DUF6868
MIFQADGDLRRNIMTFNQIRDVLMWCSIINIGILLFWFLFLAFAHDLVYRLHTKWFKISPETFDIIHYSGIIFYKFCVGIFNIIPFIAMLIVGRS